MIKLLKAFTQFFRENSEAYSALLEYKESAPHLLLMAFLQRIVNGGGILRREYALGRKRVDLFIEWKKKYTYIMELKIKRGEDTRRKGLEQTAEYLDISGAHEAHLIIFNRDPHISWEEKITHETVIFNNAKIHIWEM